MADKPTTDKPMTTRTRTDKPMADKHAIHCTNSSVSQSTNLAAGLLRVVCTVVVGHHHLLLRRREINGRRRPGQIAARLVHLSRTRALVLFSRRFRNQPKQHFLRALHNATFQPLTTIIHTTHKQKHYRAKKLKRKFTFLSFVGTLFSFNRSLAKRFALRFPLFVKISR